MISYIYKEQISDIENRFGIELVYTLENIGYGEQAIVFDDVTDSFSDLDDWLDNGDVGTCYEDSNEDMHYKVSVVDGVFDFVL